LWPSETCFGERSFPAGNVCLPGRAKRWLSGDSRAAEAASAICAFGQVQVWWLSGGFLSPVWLNL